MSILIKQKKSDPGNWHVVAQSNDEKKIEKKKMEIARKENTAFVKDREFGDILGNKTSLFVFEDKSPFKNSGIPD